MKILIYGAGVIGSIYAARLHGPIHEVYLLARGERLADLRQHGLILQHAITGEETFLRVPLVTEMAAEDGYDLAIVAVRLNQLAPVLPDFAANRRIETVLFMVNHAAGYEEWLDTVGVEHVLVGFPGFAGAAVGPVVEYVDVPVFVQKTTIGEPDGSITPRLLMVANLLRRAGLAVSISRNMDAWQKTHAAIVAPLAAGVCAAEDRASRLAHSPEVVRLIVRSVRECFAIFSELHVPITPARAKLLEWLPDRLLEDLLLRWVHTHDFEELVARHARNARDEMACLSDQLLGLARRACVETPALNTLRGQLTPGLPQERDTPTTTVSV